MLSYNALPRGNKHTLVVRLRETAFDIVVNVIRRRLAYLFEQPMAHESEQEKSKREFPASASLASSSILVSMLSRSVDAAAPAGHYVVTAGSGTGNGTVYDSKSKLTWQQTASSTTYTWADAKTYCAGVGSNLGGTGWRLPTIKELLSIVDLSQTTAPYIDPTAFPSTPATWFWSSSPVAGLPSYVWVVHFSYGATDGLDITDTSVVRCVR